MQSPYIEYSSVMPQIFEFLKLWDSLKDDRNEHNDKINAYLPKIGILLQFGGETLAPLQMF